MKTSIIILTYNKLSFTKQCVESIRQYTNKGTYEIIVVDNCSSDGTIEWLSDQSDIITIYNDENLGFPKGCNQGIEVATGDNILLLNNDVIVTQNWLENLVTSLYSAEDIGAVGPVTNSAAYYTSIPVSYTNLDEMHQFSRDFNVSDSSKWEERLKLIGFCMLIKKEVIEKIGLLDERFTPGNFEDDDYSLRIRVQGYKLLLCKDVFIHHYGSISWKDNLFGYSELLTGNEKKFMDKWGTSSNSYIIHNDLINEIPFKDSKVIDVLHIGCDAGGTLLKIKNTYPCSSLVGIEENTQAAKEASMFAEVINTTFEQALEDLKDRKFDLILLTNWNKINNKKLFLQSIKKNLTNDGILLASILNGSHINVINSIINGENPHFQNSYLTLTDINSLFVKELQLKLQVVGVTIDLKEEEKKLIEIYCSLSQNEMKTQYETFKYIISAKKYNASILKTVINIYQQNDVEENLEELKKYDEEEIIESIVNGLEEPVQLLQSLAIANFSHNNHEHVLPYLNKAHELDPSDADALYNLGLILYTFQEKQLAKSFLEALKDEDRDEEVIKILSELNEEEKLKEQNLVFLLRRLEFDKEVNISRRDLVALISAGIYTEQEIIDIIMSHSIKKEKILNIIATTSYENGLYNSIFPYLNKAFELEPQNADTLFNLGFILNEFGDSKGALNYLQKIELRDQEVESIIEYIQQAKH